MGDACFRTNSYAGGTNVGKNNSNNTNKYSTQPHDNPQRIQKSKVAQQHTHTNNNNNNNNNNNSKHNRKEKDYMKI